MSYILDALRRADAERSRGNVPDLHAQPLGIAAAARPERRPRWVWPAAAALLLAAIGGVAWLGWGGSEPPEIAIAVHQPPPAAAPPAVAPAIVPAPASALASAPVAAAPVAAAAPATTAPAATAAPRPIAAARPLATATPAQPGAVTPPRRPAAASPPAPAAARVWQPAELPADVRRELPALRFGGAIHSPDAASRLLIVDGLLLHEGEEAAPGVRIREIRLKSVVVEFRDRRVELAF